MIKFLSLIQELIFDVKSFFNFNQNLFSYNSLYAKI
jgi:hypothetical protein